MKSRKYKICLVFLSLFAALYDYENINVSYAGVKTEVSIERLVKSSDIIVIGKCLTSYSDWNSKKSEIYTYTLFDPIQILKGQTEVPLIIETLGGQVGSLVSTVIGAPTFINGNKFVLFLFRKRSGQLGIVGLNRGKFNIYQNNNEEITVNPHALNIILPEKDNHTSEKNRTQRQIILSELIKIIKKVCQEK